MTKTLNANGNTYTDDSDPTTGLGNGGWRTRLLPMLGDVITDVGGKLASIIGIQSDISARQTDVTNRQSDVVARQNDVIARQGDVASMQTNTQSLLTQTQTARDASAASAVLSQQWVGTASNVIVPAINYRLASAWDGTGQPTAYTLTGVVAVFRYDTRLDWDRGTWRKGKLARASSWYNETLNTSTRGAKREFPVLALVVATTTKVIIYDQHDLDSAGSPRMWMVVPVQGYGPIYSAPRGVFMLLGRLWVPTQIGNSEIDFVRDRVKVMQDSQDAIFKGVIADRSTAPGYQNATKAGLASNDSNAVHARVLPGAPLDPVSRLPVPTILVGTAGGASVIHPTGLVANITGTATGYLRVVLHPDGWMMLQDATGATVRAGRLPYSNVTETAWQVKRYWPTTGPALLNSNTQALCSVATGHAAGLVLLAEDRACPDNGMVAHVTKDYATGWMAGDCRLAAICEGAGSAGASGGELVQTPDFSSSAGWSANAGWSVSGGFANFSGATGNSINTAVAVTAGTDYTATLVVTSISGVVQVSLQGGTQVLGPAISAPGTYQIPLRAAAGNNLIIIYAGGGTTVAVDSLSLRKTGTFSDVVTGSGELVTGGDGTTTTGWTAANSAALSVASGYLRVTNGAASPGQSRQTLTTVPGETYLITFTWSNGTSTNAPGALLGTSAGIADLGLIVGSGSAGSVSGQFKAVGAITYLSFQGDATSGHYFDVKAISVKQAVPDRSYKGKGLVVNGTLNRAPVAANSDLYEVSGFSAANFLEQPYNPDLDVGTGDMCWILRAGSVLAGGYFLNRAGGGGANVFIAANNSNVSFQVSDGTNQAGVISNSVFTAGAATRKTWAFIVRRATQKLEIWCDGVLDNSVSCASVGSLTNTAAKLRIGEAITPSAGTAASGLAVSLLRFAAYAPTPAQLARIATDEGAAAIGKMMLAGTSSSVQSLALDEDTGVLSVGTADGVSQFAGLRRVGRLTQAAGTAFTAASVTSVSAGGGALLLGTPSEAGVVTEVQPVKDELRQMSASANWNDPVFVGITTDATPLDLGKVFITEGESVQIEADIQATEYGQTPVEGASYTVRARIRRPLGGNVQLVGSAYHVTVDETTATMDATITVDTTAQAFAINVTGVASKRLIWRAALRLNWISETRNAAA